MNSKAGKPILSQKLKFTYNIIIPQYVKLAFFSFFLFVVL